MLMKRRIKYIELADHSFFTPDIEDRGNSGYNHYYKCKIRHIGGQRYLIGYFDWHKAGGIDGLWNPINTWMIVFPNEINRVVYE